MAIKVLDERDGSFQEIESELDSKASLSDIEVVTGNLDNLNTTDKSSLVAAINELYQMILNL